VLFSTIKGRRKYANLTRDPRISALVYDAADPYTYAEVRGTVTISEDPRAELINELALKYTGAPFGERPGEQRVIVRIRPRRVVVYLD
jgi:PPOX class probable F420-dependent enzyme